VEIKTLNPNYRRHCVVIVTRKFENWWCLAVRLMQDSTDSFEKKNNQLETRFKSSTKSRPARLDYWVLNLSNRFDIESLDHALIKTDTKQVLFGLDGSTSKECVFSLLYISFDSRYKITKEIQASNEVNKSADDLIKW